MSSLESLADSYISETRLHMAKPNVRIPIAEAVTERGSAIEILVLSAWLERVQDDKTGKRIPQIRCLQHARNPSQRPQEGAKKSSYC